MAVKLDLSDPAILQYPAATPPPGVTPNFTHSDNQGPKFVVAGGILLAIMMMFITIRVYTKLHIINKFSWDDLTIFLSALGSIVLYGACIWPIINGPVGKHQYDIRLGDFFSANYTLPIYIMQLLIPPVLWIAKFSFFVLYLQIFWPMRWLRLSVYIGATLSTVSYWGIWITIIVLVTPRPGQSWVEALLLNSAQFTVLKLGNVIAWLGLAIDVFLLILPSIAVHQLQLSCTCKIGTLLIFSTGLVAVIASVFSICYRYRSLHTADETWILIDVELMLLMEVTVGIITNSMPSCARMFRHHLPPWATLKSHLSHWNYTMRLSSGRSQLHSQMGTKDLHSDADRNRSGHNEEDQYDIPRRATGVPQVEIDRLKTVDTYIKAGPKAL